MAALRLLNEFGREPVILALEPSRECACKCTYCFAALNSKAQLAGRTKNLEDKGTFESTVEKAFSPAYDPTHFAQWSIRNKMPVAYSNTVEPFQDIPQAKGILNVAMSIDMPLFIQTKGHNFDEIWPDLKPLAENSVLGISFPTPNDKALKRFEPGTPPAEKRIEIIKRAAEAGFYVTLMMSPYHEDWCDSPYDFVADAASWGVSQVFFDPLHLNDRQRKVATDATMVGLAKKGEYTAKRIDHLYEIKEACIDDELDFVVLRGYSTRYGIYSTVDSLCPPGVFSKGLDWPYHDGRLFHAIEGMFEREDAEEPFLVTWDQVLRSMESLGTVSQAFSMSSLRELMALNDIPAVWRRSLGEQATMSQIFRALWNNPGLKQFGWRHPFIKLAMRPNGTPWHDESGDLIAVCAPEIGGADFVVNSLDEHPTFSYEDPEGI